MFYLGIDLESESIVMTKNEVYEFKKLEMDESNEYYVT